MPSQKITLQNGATHYTIADNQLTGDSTICPVQTTGDLLIGTGADRQLLSSIRVGTPAAQGGQTIISGASTYLDSSADGQVGVGDSITTGAIAIGINQTSGNILISTNAARTGSFTIGNLAQTSGNTDILGNNVLIEGRVSTNIGSTIADSHIRIGGLQATTDTEICGNQTTGVLSIGVGNQRTGLIQVGSDQSSGTTSIEGRTVNVKVPTNGTIAMGAALTTGNVTIGGAQTSGDILIGTGSARFGSGDITMGSTSSQGNTNINGKFLDIDAAGDGIVRLGKSLTTGDLEVGTTQTTGLLQLGTGSARTGNINIGSNGSQGVTNIEGKNVSIRLPVDGTLALGNQTNTGAIFLADGQTSGVLNIGAGTGRTTGAVNVGNVASQATTNINGKAVVIDTASNGTINIGNSQINESTNIGTNTNRISGGDVNIGTKLNNAGCFIGSSTVKTRASNENSMSSDAVINLTSGGAMTLTSGGVLDMIVSGDFELKSNTTTPPTIVDIGRETGRTGVIRIGHESATGDVLIKGVSNLRVYRTVEPEIFGATSGKFDSSTFGTCLIVEYGYWVHIQATCIWNSKTGTGGTPVGGLEVRFDGAGIPNQNINLGSTELNWIGTTGISAQLQNDRIRARISGGNNIVTLYDGGDAMVEGDFLASGSCSFEGWYMRA